VRGATRPPAKAPANRLTARAVSDGRSYTYAWSDRGELLAEETQGVDVRTFEWDAAGRLVEATVFTLTTYFTYAGDGTRVAVEVANIGVMQFIPDYADGIHILAESTGITSTLYLYGKDCLGERRDGKLLYYLHDGQEYVRQGTDTDGAVAGAWLYSPDGDTMAGPYGPVSHLVCSGVYDWSTGLLYRGGHYFDPSLGIWVTLMPLIISSRQKRRGRKSGTRWATWLLLIGVGLGGVLIACGPQYRCPPTLPVTPPSDACTVLPLPPVSPYMAGPTVRITSPVGNPVPVPGDPRGIGRGSFLWRVHYELETPAEYETQIFQEADAWQGGTGNVWEDMQIADHFLETWPVHTGNTQVSAEFSSGGLNDAFGCSGSEALEGQRTFSGNVKSYYACPFPLDSSWYQKTYFWQGYMHRGTYRTDTIPDWWDPTDATSHILHIEWNGIRSWGYIHYRGFDEHFEIK